MKTIPENLRRKLFANVSYEGEKFEEWGIKDETEWRDLGVVIKEGVEKEIDGIAKRRWAKVELHLLSVLQRIEVELPKVAPVTSGWNLLHKGRYLSVEPDDLPKAMCLDVETVKSGTHWHPICAVVVGDAYTYVWVREKELYPKIHDVIPFPNDRIVIGWNVHYDRQMLSSELSFEDSGNRFIDGRAFMTAMHAISDQQVGAYAILGTKIRRPLWYEQASKTSLEAASRFLLNRPLDKSVRANIEKMMWEEFPAHIDEIVKYCAKDVHVTMQCTQRLYHNLRTEYVGSEVSLVGQMEMGSGIVPLSKHWYNYIQRCDVAYAEIVKKHAEMLITLAQQKNDNDYRLDWTLLKSGKYKGEAKWRREFLKNPTMGTRTAAILLGLQWREADIEWEKVGNSGRWKTEYEDIPHPEGGSKNVCNILSSDFKAHVENNVLSSMVLSKEELLGLYDELESLTSWKSIAGRCSEVRAVKKDEGFIVVPQTLVMGTQSRRATDNTWLVAVKAQETKIGSEFRGMIEAPKGYKIVGADFDQEELVLASMLGDKYEGKLASSPFCRSILVGDKSKKTDVHSLVATRQNISRHLGKTMNFAAQYLCGENKLAITLVSERPDLDVKDAKAMAKSYLLDTRGMGKTHYTNGIASNIFNAMIELADTRGARSPILNFKIPASLDKTNVGTDFLTTRVNWTIQTSGVDIMHLVMTVLTELIRRDSLGARLMLTLHDELRWLVPDKEVRMFANLMQEAHLKVMAYAYIKMGFKTMPMSQAWFSAVDVDTRLRKEVDDMMITPTNPHGFPITGYSLFV